jgi:hypothetical protein
MPNICCRVQENLHAFLTSTLDTGKTLKYLLDTRLGGAYSKCGYGGNEKIPTPYWEANPSHIPLSQLQQ